MIPAHSSGAACKSSSCDGIGKQKSALANAYSAYPPLTEYPVNVGASHKFSIPRRQYAQVPSVPPIHETPTRVPAFSPSPAWTSPTIWCPGMILGRSGSSSPSTTCRSVRHTPQAFTRSNTWSGCGSGTGTSSIRRGALLIGAGVVRTAAFIGNYPILVSSTHRRSIVSPVFIDSRSRARQTR